jgi:hypothetical protein
MTTAARGHNPAPRRPRLGAITPLIARSGISQRGAIVQVFTVTLICEVDRPSEGDRTPSRITYETGPMPTANEAILAMLRWCESVGWVEKPPVPPQR